MPSSSASQSGPNDDKTKRGWSSKLVARLFPSHSSKKTILKEWEYLNSSEALRTAPSYTLRPVASSVTKLPSRSSRRHLAPVSSRALPVKRPPVYVTQPPMAPLIPIAPLPESQRPPTIYIPSSPSSSSRSPSRSRRRSRSTHSVSSWQTRQRSRSSRSISSRESRRRSRSPRSISSRRSPGPWIPSSHSQSRSRSISVRSISPSRSPGPWIPSSHSQSRSRSRSLIPPPTLAGPSHQAVPIIAPPVVTPVVLTAPQLHPSPIHSERSISPPRTPLLSPSESLVMISDSVIQAVERMLRDKELYRALLKCRNTDAQNILNAFQKLLDRPSLDANTQGLFLKAMMRLSLKSGLYPQCLTLRQISVDQQNITAGQFGEIWLGRFRGEKVCLKVIKTYSPQQVEHLLKKFLCEAIVWSRLFHSNLVPFYGIYHLKDRLDRICLVSPWMENGNITEYLKANPAAPRGKFVHHIAEGLKYLHDNNIVHGDLKGLNVLINHWGMACLTDFGLSSVMDAEALRWTTLETSTQFGGTVRWVASEILEGDKETTPVTFSSDIWSFAAVLYEVLTARVPFYEYTREATVMYQRMSGKLPRRPSQKMAPELTNEIWDLMQECWKHDPIERPTIHEIISRLPKLDQVEKPPFGKLEGQLKEKVMTFRHSMYGHDSYMTVDEFEVLTKFSDDGRIETKPIQKSLEEKEMKKETRKQKAKEWVDTQLRHQTEYIDPFAPHESISLVKRSRTLNDRRGYGWGASMARPPRMTKRDHIARGDGRHGHSNI